ncbi:unnamed protein product [Blumeria hordei]|uniref:DUF7492 domain-containing protein n=1 Tax=Blumeria hordei TaxID=2867405 RepID=A0A383UNL3_BLUHO|nr:unnamed protein product [Blumeria hordei]
MKFPIGHGTAFVCFSLSVLLIPTLAHTWVESVNLIASDGSFQDVGYARGFVGRTPGVDPDTANTYLIPPNGRSTGGEILPTDLMCKDSQVKQQQSEGYPRLSASPQDRISLAYHENGHVTQFKIQEGKPAGRGTVFIYGTKESSPTDTYLGIHRVWNTEGSGGDKRGKLLATRPFDDGQCHQINNEKLSKDRAKALGFSDVEKSPEILCQSALQLPTDAGTTGTYTLYWVWEWPTLDKAGQVFQNESYTSCIDIDMVETSKPHAADVNQAVKSSGKPDPNSLAVKEQLENDNQFIVDPTAPAEKASDNPFTRPGSSPEKDTSTSTSTSSIPASITSHTTAPQTYAPFRPLSFVTVTVTVSANSTTISQKS